MKQGSVRSDPADKTDRSRPNPCREPGTLPARNGTQFGSFRATSATGSEPQMPEIKGNSWQSPVIQLTMK